MSAETILPTSKICAKCGVDKPLNEFNKRSASRDGLRHICRHCQNAYQADYQAENRDRYRVINRRYYERHCDRINEKKRAIRKTSEGKLAKSISNRKYDSKNHEKGRAHKVLSRAIKNGSITRQPCVVCCDPNSHGHHPDYSKPLDVIWLCSLHHRKVHSGELDQSQLLSLKR